MASSSFFWSAGDAEVVVGHGVFRVEFDGLAVGGDGLVQLLLVAQGDAEVEVGKAYFGSSSMALRKAAMASSSFFWSRRALPRLL